MGVKSFCREPEAQAVAEPAALERRAVLDFGTPQGVDNVDAYCLMVGSFRWG